jgi:hypothetical protein
MPPMSYPNTPTDVDLERDARTLYRMRRYNPAYRYDAATMTAIYDLVNRRADAGNPIRFGTPTELAHKGRSWAGR